MRTLDTATQNAIDGTEIWPVRLITMQIGSVTYAISDHYRPIITGGITYVPNGNLLSIDNVTNSTSANEDSIEVALSAIDPIFRRDVLDADSVGGTVRIFRGLINSETGELVSTPINFYNGIIYSVNISEEYPTNVPTNTIQATGFSITVDIRSTTFRLEELPGRFTNDNSNREVDANDRGMEFVAGLNGRNVRFGGTG